MAIGEIRFSKKANFNPKLLTASLTGFAVKPKD
jgi:hypothetical protein